MRHRKLKSFNMAGGILVATIMVSACKGSKEDGEPQGADPEMRVPLAIVPILPGQVKLQEEHRYAADGDNSETLFNSIVGSMKARRDFAWRVVEKVTAPVVTGRKAEDGGDIIVPAFYTWVTGNQMAESLSKFYQEQYSGNEEQLDQLHAAFYQSSSYDDQGSESWFKANVWIDETTQNGVVEDSTLQHGNPAFIKHMFQKANFTQRGQCNSLDIDQTKEASPTNFAPCLAAEFPRDAVVLKSLWVDIDKIKMPVADSSAAGMTKLFEHSSKSWAATYDFSIDRGTMTTENMFTVQDRDGTRYGLGSLHIVTKEVRNWVWISLWWHDRPHEDFGADRPESLNNTIWANYKLCVTLDFQELDENPWSSYTDDQTLSLGEALKAVQGKTGQDTWCANPLLEGEPNNGVSNCLGCHQIAGERGKTAGQILKRDNPRSLDEGRTGFPNDYIFSIQSPSFLGKAIFGD